MPGGNKQKILDEIEKRWDELTNSSDAADNSRIALPNPFITPSNGIFHGDQFYWDTYFIILGLLPSGRTELAKGTVDNLLFLLDRFDFVPMRNRYYNTGISQPPLLTSMIRLVYDGTNDAEWLAHAMGLAEREYHEYWTADQTTDRFAQHNVFEGLSRYADHYLVHQTAEHESGWDMSSRFNNRCLDILPIDLNALLYKYETDFAWYYELHDPNKANDYRRRAEQRQASMNKLMWNEEDKRYYDYDYQRKKQTRFVASSCYVPLWANLANNSQAKLMSDSLSDLLKLGGVVNTAIGSLPQKQWDYPNGWAPMQWFVIEGLKNYGFNDQADAIAARWNDMVEKVFAETGELWEKYDVVHQKPGKPGRYPNQTGFGWTNGVYVRLST